jgi:predicted secreted protein
MSIAYGLAVYFIFWWITLLVTLPFGVRSNHDTGEMPQPGQDQGAPVVHRLKQKMLWTTGISAALFLLFFANWHFGWLTLEKLPGPDKLY